LVQIWWIKVNQQERPDSPASTDSSSCAAHQQGVAKGCFEFNQFGQIVDYWLARD